jgi:hypothetical protein
MGLFRHFSGYPKILWLPIGKLWSTIILELEVGIGHPFTTFWDGPVDNSAQLLMNTLTRASENCT